jgi:hypothetical protein
MHVSDARGGGDLDVRCGKFKSELSHSIFGISLLCHQAIRLHSCLKADHFGLPHLHTA